MSKYAQGQFIPKNQDKYLGNGHPKYRSSWEWAFMQFCDNNPGIIGWASESIRIPYLNPFTGKQSSYIPDFLIQYQDKNGKKHVELLEIKPLAQMTMEGAGKSQRNKAAVILNTCKWAAAKAWCKAQGITFRVVSEKDLFHMGGKKS